MSEKEKIVSLIEKHKETICLLGLIFVFLWVAFDRGWHESSQYTNECLEKWGEEDYECCMSYCSCSEPPEDGSLYIRKFCFRGYSNE